MSSLYFSHFTKNGDFLILREFFFIIVNGSLLLWEQGAAGMVLERDSLKFSFIKGSDKCLRFWRIVCLRLAFS